MAPDLRPPLYGCRGSRWLTARQVWGKVRTLCVQVGANVGADFVDPDTQVSRPHARSTCLSPEILARVV